MASFAKVGLSATLTHQRFAGSSLSQPRSYCSGCEWDFGLRGNIFDFLQKKALIIGLRVVIIILPLVGLLKVEIGGQTHVSRTYSGKFYEIVAVRYEL